MQSKIIFVILAMFGPVAFGADRQMGLTVYNNDTALVKDQRELEFKPGVTESRFADVAATIEPSSVRFRSLTDPEARIVEQNYQFDLVGSAKLLEKYVDQAVEVLTVKGELVRGKLLRAQEQEIILQENGPIRILSVRQIAGIKLAKLPEGLLTRPTLVWQMYSPKGGRQTVQLDYLARNIRWEMAYNAVLSEDEKFLDLVGWVTLTNNSGTDFPGAKVALVAGDVSRDSRPQMMTFGVDYLRSLSKLPPSGQRGKEISESFGEYHLYRLPESTDVRAAQVKQVKLIQTDRVPVEKMYLYDGAKVQFWPFQVYFGPEFGREENKKVNVILAVENRADRRLGIALPPGLVRIYKRDRDQSLEFVGEDKLPATSVDERVMVYIGDAFDLVGERTQTDFKRPTERSAEESFKIELKNHKKEPVTIQVVEKMYRARDGEIMESSRKYEKLDARTIRFTVPVKPDGTETVEYRVGYRW